MVYFEKTGGKSRLKFAYGGCYATFIGKNPYGNHTGSRELFKYPDDVHLGHHKKQWLLGYFSF